MAKSRVYLTLFIFMAGFLLVFGTSGAVAQTQPDSSIFSRNLTIGSAGSDVISLQAILIADGFLTVAQPTGYFGGLTASAVATWQANVGLPSTGYIGALSRAKLNGNGGITPMPITTSPPPTPTPAPAPTPISTTFSRNLTIGDSGSDVSSLQATLIAEGFLTVPNPTGYFGSLTASALANWQASVGLPNTGYFGALSRASITTVPVTTNPDGGNLGVQTPQTLPTTPTAIPTPTTISPPGSGGGGGGGSPGPAPSPPQSPPLSPIPVTPPTQPAPPFVPPPPSDITPPTVSITTPLNNSIVSSTITVFANASDDAVVTQVNFYLDNVLQHTSFFPPYTWAWNTGLSTNAVHSIMVKAYDAVGNIGTTFSSVTVNNLDMTPPTVSITSPVNGATIMATTTIVSNTTDNIGIASVQFKLDGMNVGAPDTIAPYQIFWNPLTVPVGTHIFSAVATDVAGNMAIAANTTITVTRPPADITPPTASITTPVAGSTITNTITVTATAADNIYVTKVEFYIDNTLKNTAPNAPYTFTLNTTTLTPGAHTFNTKAYDAAGNIGISANVPITVVIAAPTVPTSVTVASTSLSTVTLSWSPSSELGGAITGYKIFRGGVQIATAVTTSLIDAGLSAGTTYSYTISSYDAAGNNSALSNPVSVTTKTTPTNPIVNYNFGISVGETLMGLSPATLNAELNDITSLGIGWIRFNIQWDHVQPNGSNNYTWINIDNFVAAANAHHIKLIALLADTPSWAWSSACAASVGTDRCPPADPAQFATYVTAVVSRYAPQGINDWEIWNEPNLGGAWEPVADPVAYTTLLKSAYTAIKAVQPSAGVLSGSMGPASSTNGNIAPVSFLTQMYANGAGPYFDAVGFHPYSFPAMPSFFPFWNAWQQMAATTPSLRSVMTANGDAGKRIWITEYGAPTGGPGLIETSATDTLFLGTPDHVSEALQTQMISQAITNVKGYSWAGPFFIYSYRDQGTSQSTIENFFGIIRYDGSTKPAYTTIQDLLNP